MKSEVLRPADGDCVCPSCPILASITRGIEREFHPLEHDKFCAVLETGDFQSYQSINGVQIIELPRAVLFNTGSTCFMLLVNGTKLDAFFDHALARVDALAHAA